MHHHPSPFVRHSLSGAHQATKKIINREGIRLAFGASELQFNIFRSSNFLSLDRMNHFAKLHSALRPFFDKKNENVPKSAKTCFPLINECTVQIYDILDAFLVTFQHCANAK